ncbi:MAG: hypothetical protein PWP48_825 [Clostridiales bacterium]|jgi:hypothetical protein|nr:hypothetical protein [Clostridiales bacterium]
MDDIAERLSKIEERITDESFLKNKGLGNEVGYYIFDYPPEYELDVREYVAYLKDKINRSDMGVKIVEFDLYDIVIDMLKERNYLEKCFEFEKTKGIDYAFEAIMKMLRLTSPSNLLVNHIVANTPPRSVVFITGVGKCYPFVRSHNVLNNLHQVLDSVPVVMFFPGKYSGQDLRLFGTIKDDNYYRAFKLV